MPEPTARPARGLRRLAAVTSARRAEDRAWTVRDRTVQTATTDAEWNRLRNQGFRLLPEHRAPAATRLRGRG
jgi:hypothetical protein